MMLPYPMTLHWFSIDGLDVKPPARRSRRAASPQRQWKWTSTEHKGGHHPCYFHPVFSFHTNHIEHFSRLCSSLSSLHVAWIKSREEEETGTHGWSRVEFKMLLLGQSREVRSLGITHPLGVMSQYHSFCTLQKNPSKFLQAPHYFHSWYHWWACSFKRMEANCSVICCCSKRRSHHLNVKGASPSHK